MFVHPRGEAQDAQNNRAANSQQSFAHGHKTVRTLHALLRKSCAATTGGLHRGAPSPHHREQLRYDEGRPRPTRLPAYYTASRPWTHTRPRACACRARPSWPRFAPEAKPGATLPPLPSNGGLGAARAAGALGLTREPLAEKKGGGEGGRWCRWAAFAFKDEQTHVTGQNVVQVASTLPGTQQQPQLVNTALFFVLRVALCKK